jgi:hypothetical protein
LAQQPVEAILVRHLADGADLEAAVGAAVSDLRPGSR